MGLVNVWIQNILLQDDFFLQRKELIVINTEKFISTLKEMNKLFK